MTNCERPLDTNEALFYAFDKVAAYRTAQALQLVGKLEEDVLREALRRLALVHCRLSTAIVDTANGPTWQMRDIVPLLERVPLAEHPAIVVAKALNRPDARDRPLWNTGWSAAADEHLLCLSLHHSVADGVSAAQLAVDLVNLINDVIDGRPPRRPVEPSLPLDEALAKATLSQQIAYHASRVPGRLSPRTTKLLAIDKNAGPGERQTRLAFDTVDAATLTALRARAKLHGATVGGVLTAAVLRAIGRIEDTRGDLDVSTQISLRQQCIPNIPTKAIGCYSANTHTFHDPAQEVWRMARACTHAVHRTMRRRDPDIALMRTRGHIGAVARAIDIAIADTKTAGRSGVLSVSNCGVMEAPDAGGKVRLVGFYPGVANHPAGAFLQLSCGTLAGELMCSWMWVAPLISNERAHRIWSAARDELSAAIR